jgi:hypothetical protein
MVSRLVAKYGRQVPAIELHALDKVGGGLDGLGLFHGDYAVLADLLHGIGDLGADFHVVVGEMAATWAISSLSLMSLAIFLISITDGNLDRLVDAALQAHGIDAGGDGS